MARRARKGKGEKPAPPSPQPESPAASREQATTAATDPASVTAAPPATPAAASAPASRTASTLLIALFLLYQLLMPLRYYLGGRGYDERFSWRMFSSVRMQQCRVVVSESTKDGDSRDLDLNREVQVAWIGMLERYRPQVVDKLLQRRCAEPDVSEARYVRNCKKTDGSALPELTVTLDCARSAFTRAGVGRGDEEAP
jgi:hypothetical protein